MALAELTPSNLRGTLDRIAARIADAVRAARTDAESARLVADAVRIHDPRLARGAHQDGTALPGAELLTPAQRAGSPDGYTTHTLYASPEFSVVAAVFRPGQATPIHDHLTWCVVGVIQGVEHETLYELRAGQPVPVRVNDNQPGTVVGFAPPGDIHRVVNVGDDVAISMHVYGVDMNERESSVRRIYG